MSCRILKRGVEYLHIEKLLDFCRANGLATIYGDYIPTPKNKLVSDLFADLGFEKTNDETGESVRWRFKLGHSHFKHRHFIRLKETEEHDSRYSGDSGPIQRDLSRCFGR